MNSTAAGWQAWAGQQQLAFGPCACEDRETHAYTQGEKGLARGVREAPHGMRSGMAASTAAAGCGTRAAMGRRVGQKGVREPNRAKN